MPSEVSAIMNELPDLAEAQVEDVALKEEAISGEEQVNLDENEETPKKKRNKKSRPLNPKEAMEKYWHRGIYVEEDEIRCRCNNKNCNKWDTYQYDRHFGFKVHKRYEEEEADETFHRSTMVAFVQSEAEKEAHRISLPGAAPALPSIPAFSTVHVGKSRTGEDARMQEDHWMKMWSAAKDELKKLRQDLKDEEDEEVIGEIEADIKGLRKRKADFAKLLGFVPEL